MVMSTQIRKAGGCNIMQWGGFVYTPVFPLQKNHGIMRNENYLNIFQAYFSRFVDTSVYPEEEDVFQKDIFPKKPLKNR